MYRTNPFHWRLACYDDTWDETDPADADAASDGAREMRQDIKRGTRQRMETYMTDNTAPVPPVTITDVDSAFSTAQEPIWIMGEQVDMRGMTWRRPASVTDVASRLASQLNTWAPLGNPGGAPASGAFFISLTPVDADRASALVEARLQCLIHATGPGTTTAATNRLGFRIVGDPGGADIIFDPPGGGVNDGVAVGLKLDTLDDDWISLNFVAYSEAIPAAATRIEPQINLRDATPAFTVRGDIVASHFTIIEHV